MTNQVQVSSLHVSMASLLLSPLAFYLKPHKKIAAFCTDIADPATTPERGVATEFFTNKCGLTDAEIPKSFRHCNAYPPAKLPSQNMEEVLELLKGYDVTTPTQIRRVVNSYPKLFFRSVERQLKPKLSFLGTFMKKEDITKFLLVGASTLTSSIRRHKSAISVLQNLGIEGEAMPELLLRQPRLLTATEEAAKESFQQAEDLGFKKGTKMFAIALRSIYGLGMENLNRRLKLLISLGFSENQISDLCRRRPSILRVSEEKLKHNVNFVVNIVGLPLAYLVQYPNLFGYRVETRMFPRYRVMEALKSMDLELPKKKVAKFGRIVRLREELFLEKYIYSNAESSFLLDIYHGRRKICKADH